MKLGILTGFSEEMVRFAAEAGFECLEISGPPNEWLENPGEAEKAKKLLEENGLTVASFLTGWPSIRADEEEAKAHLERLSKIMDLCKMMDDAIITGAGPMGYDPGKSLEENVQDFKRVFSPIVELAEKKGVKLAFENWPGRGPYLDGGSLAVTPETWEAMFDAIKSDNLGLEFDPSHLIWQWIDPIQAAREFIGKIFIVHAKDTEIFWDRLRRTGAYKRGWWTYRLPGFASFDWHRFFALLIENGFDGNVIIEHEDPRFGGERRLLGFKLSGSYLRTCMMKS
ncbi:sugar phosphate isomerase/epimerase [Candidatus Poribacteria bacterium]|nr:MAG: sugar phosphate isomerase/epimerase [Candidatus Poribacteria bacterium]